MSLRLPALPRLFALRGPQLAAARRSTPQSKPPLAAHSLSAGLLEEEKQRER